MSLRWRNVAILVGAIYGFAVVYSVVYIIVSIITPAHNYGG